MAAHACSHPHPPGPPARYSLVGQQAGEPPAADAHRPPLHPQRPGSRTQGVCFPARWLLAGEWGGGGWGLPACLPTCVVLRWHVCIRPPSRQLASSTEHCIASSAGPLCQPYFSPPPPPAPTCITCAPPIPSLQDVSSLEDFFETNLDFADPEALMGLVRACAVRVMPACLSVPQSV